MPTIADQIELERAMVIAGEEAYRRTQASALEKGRGAETGFARRLMEEYIKPIAEDLDRQKALTSGPGIRGRAMGHIRGIASDRAAYLTLRVVFQRFLDIGTATALANVLGKHIEDEIRFTRFREKYKEYYDTIVEDFRRKGTKDYRYMHRVMTHSANAHEDGWEPWAMTERIDVGARLLDVVLRTTDLIEKTTRYNKGKTIYQLQPTEAAFQFVKDHDEAASLLNPRTAPCIIPPDPWTAFDQGGYYTPELRNATKLVITRNRWHKRMLRKHSMPQVLEAINHTQNVAWSVNNKVLDVARAVWAQNLAIGVPSSQKMVPPPSPFPDMKKEDMDAAELARFVEWKRNASEIYTQEKERVGKAFQTTSIIRMAHEYSSYNAFYYVWAFDFRGRMYAATAGFSPQGPDLAKGFLMFRNGKALGERGVFWLKVHGANRFGYDKVDYPDRVKWVDDNHEFFMAAAADPLNHTDIWGKADKPYQFLAFLFEYAAMMNGALVGIPPEKFVSHIPVGLDGSCNGLQHFSAMLRDEKGGRATNLIPGPVPADIYREVADVCLKHVRGAGAELIYKEWLKYAQMFGDGKLPRNVAKRPVMTQPYGSTRQSCTQYIFQAIKETAPGFFKSESDFAAASKLTPLMWRSIGEVVVAAREAMDWLKQCASVVNKTGKGMTWKTHDNFIVHMYERKLETAWITTVLNGRFSCKIGNVTDELDPNGQRSGVSPNFVHSHDAAHLRATVRRAVSLGITDLALIHDDYGTHAANTDLLHRAIREAFVEQYEQFDPIASFAKWQTMTTGKPMPDAPAMGNLDIRQVLDSPFFFG